jgi:hypothetical protein
VVGSPMKNKVSLMLSVNIFILNLYILIWIHIMNICNEFIHLMLYMNL